MRRRSCEGLSKYKSPNVEYILTLLTNRTYVYKNRPTVSRKIKSIM